LTSDHGVCGAGRESRSRLKDGCGQDWPPHGATELAVFLFDASSLGVDQSLLLKVRDDLASSGPGLFKLLLRKPRALLRILQVGVVPTDLFGLVGHLRFQEPDACDPILIQCYHRLG
jgi:hypothetical protein